jgi:hypothetical protein
MKTVDNRVIASSERLFHDFLKRSSWTVTSSNELTLFRNSLPAPEVPAMIARSMGSVVIDAHTALTEIGMTTDVLSPTGLEIAMKWSFQDQREVFPWMLLRLTSRGGGQTITISHGLCSPERSAGVHVEKWRVTSSSRIPPGDYDAEAFFLDYARALWAQKSQGQAAAASLARVSLGQITVPHSDFSSD